MRRRLYLWSPAAVLAIWGVAVGVSGGSVALTVIGAGLLCVAMVVHTWQLIVDIHERRRKRWG